MHALKLYAAAVTVAIFAVGCKGDDTPPPAASNTPPPVIQKPGGGGGGASSMNAKNMTMGPGASNQFGTKASGN